MVEQGSIIKIQNLSFPILVVSNNFFNETGMIVGCPIFNIATESPLHVHIDCDKVKGNVYCEDLKTFDLKSRRYTWLDTIDMFQAVEIVDIIQGIFDYI